MENLASKDMFFIKNGGKDAKNKLPVKDWAISEEIKFSS